MEITFVTTAANDEEAYALLKEFGLPFKNDLKEELRRYGKGINEGPRGKAPQAGRAICR